MIRLTFSGVQWGTDAIEETNPETGSTVKGRQINLLDPTSGILVHVPFSGDSLQSLVEEMAKGLTDAQRRQLAPVFTGGIVVPNGNGPLA